MLVLNGANTYTGATTISQGTLQLGINNPLPTATPLTIANSGELDLDGGVQQVGSLSGSAGAIVTNSFPAVSGTLTVSSPTAGATTYAGDISGVVALAVSGSGELTLSGTDNYSGGTTISGGTLDIAAASALSNSGMMKVSGGGRLILGSASGIEALLAASSPADSGEVALGAAASAPATIGGYENTSEDMATLGGAPLLSQGGGGGAVGGSAAAVPEPGTLVLLAAGVLMLAVARRRRRG
jgi:autotransporter-associated beta strand protein